MKNISILLAAYLFFVSCSPKNGNENELDSANETLIELTNEQLKNTEIITGKIDKKNIVSVLKVSGIIDVPPQNMVTISIPLGGYLKHTKLLPGMHISKGEVIAIMEDQQYIQLQQEYLTASANFKLKELDFNRQKELNISKASSDKILQQAETEYISQKILLKSFEEKLKLIGINPEKLNENNLSKNISITSPIDGYVSDINVNIGKYVNPSDVLFELVNPEDIHLNMTVFEKDIDKLNIGQKVFAFTNHSPENKYECEIILVGKKLTDERSVEVHCHFVNYDKNLIPGMFMNAEIEIKTNNTNVLPEDAIVRFENKTFVFLAKSKNSFEMIETSIGSTFNEYTEILIDEKYLHKTFVTKDAYTLLMALKNKEE